MRVFTGEVVRVAEVTPSMRRVVLGGPGVADYRSTGVGDEYVRLVFPTERGGVPVLPAVAGDDLDYASIDLATMRTYTVRDVDPDAGEVTVDFVVHEGGLAAGWALAARPGDLVGLNTPQGMYAPPDGLTWQVLVADCAGLPAAARLVASAPPQVRTRLVVEVPDEAHQVDLDGPDGTEVTWVHGGNGHGPSHLEDVVRSLRLPTDGVGYVWVAGETRVLRGVRRYLRRELGLPAGTYKAVGYWTDHAEEWRDRYAALDEDTRAALDAIWSSGEAEDEMELRYDQRLTELGL
jgi:NADPH-dependent ferric siderophore reductase